MDTNWFFNNILELAISDGTDSDALMTEATKTEKQEKVDAMLPNKDDKNSKSDKAFMLWWKKVAGKEGYTLTNSTYQEPEKVEVASSERNKNSKSDKAFELWLKETEKQKSSPRSLSRAMKGKKIKQF